MKYNKGAPLVITKGVYTGASGWVIENDNSERAKLGMPYLVGFEHFEFGEGSEWFSEDYLMHLDELQKLQAENERLKAALEKLLMVSHYTSDAHPKRGIECKRCAQWGVTRADVIHLDWCEVGEAKDMLRSEAK